MQTSFDRVFDSKELTNNIFSSASRSDAAICARVCRQWESSALDHVWREMPSVTPIIELLAPLKRLSGRSSNFLCLSYLTEIKTFSRRLQVLDWERFERHARRVESLTLCAYPSEANITKGDFKRDVFIELARTRTLVDILPNLRVLNIESSQNYWFEFSSLLLHYKVRYLNLSIDDATGVEFLFDEIAGRCSRIKSFTIQDYPGKCDTDDPLVKFLPKLKWLKDFKSGNVDITPDILRSLECTSGLETFQGSYDGILGKRRSKLPKGFTETDEDAPFFSLRALSLIATLEEARLLFTPCLAFHNLKVLCLTGDLRPTVDVQHLGGLLRIISERCDQLEEIIIDDQPTGSGNVTSHSSMRIAESTLKPLSSLKRLKAITIKHSLAIDMEDVELASLFQEHAFLETLCLSPNPITSHVATSRTLTSLTLNVLPILAKKCPKLSSLSLFISASNVPDLSRTVVRSRFKNLRTLDLGRSPIRDPDSVIIYLANILPVLVDLNCTISGGMPICSIKNRMERETIWKNGLAAFPLLMKSQELNERIRKRALRHPAPAKVN